MTEQTKRLENIAITAPTELQAVLDLISKANGHATLTNVQFRRLEASFHGGSDWEQSTPKPLANRIHTQQCIGGDSSHTVIETEFWQSFVGQIPEELMGSKDEPRVFGVVVKAAIEVVYAFDDVLPFDDASRMAFVKVNGIMVVWPFWREWVSSSMARLNAQGQIAPFMNITKAVHMAGLFDTEKLAEDAIAEASKEKPPK